MSDFRPAIRQHRVHRFTLALPPGVGPVTVALTRHRFQFGTNLFGLCRPEGPWRETYSTRAFALVNAGTLPFYWGRYEPQRGHVDPEGVGRAAEEAAARGVTLKGHPLCWHTVCAPWLLDEDDDTILGLLLDRIRREVTTYKGLVDTWDVVNEAVILPRFDRYDNAISRLARRFGAVELVLRCFRAARESNPDAVLLINDFNLGDEYARLVTELLDRGCPLDALGLQTHQHEGYRGVDTVADYLGRFEGFGLPLHFTENTILSGDLAPRVDDLNDVVRPEWPSTPEGEALQAAQAEEFYSQLYAHPLVEAIVWWDLEDGNWLNAPGGLLRRDLSPKPAYHRLRELIHTEWGFPARTLVPQGNRLTFEGPEGTYEVSFGGLTRTLTLTKNRALWTV